MKILKPTIKQFKRKFIKFYLNNTYIKGLEHFKIDKKYLPKDKVLRYNNKEKVLLYIFLSKVNICDCDRVLDIKNNGQFIIDSYTKLVKTQITQYCRILKYNNYYTMYGLFNTKTKIFKYIMYIAESNRFIVESIKIENRKEMSMYSQIITIVNNKFYNNEEN